MRPQTPLSWSTQHCKPGLSLLTITQNYARLCTGKAKSRSADDRSHFGKTGCPDPEQ
jgi:hypothetical protein